MRYGLDMLLGDILEDEMCRETFEKIFPGIIERFSGQQEAVTLSVRQLAMYTGGLLPSQALEQLDEALKEIGRRCGGVSPAEAKRIKTYLAIWEAEQKAEQQTTAATHHQTAVYPGQPWLDVQGKRIQAHAGGFLYEDGVYYWYGENKEYTDGKSKIWTWGIRLYTSRDFYNWEDRGLIIPPDLSSPDAAFFPEKHIDRPHILRNPITGRYVCWCKDSGTDACFHVLEAESLFGPWKLVRERLNPEGLRIGVFDIAVDKSTQTAYLYCEANHASVRGFRLNQDFTDIDEAVSVQYDGMHPPFTREGVTVFCYNHRLWMFTSGMTGYIPNQSDFAVSDGYTQPFASVGDPHVDDDSLSSFNSQISQVFRVPGKKDLYLAIADRWVPEYPVDRERALQLRRAIASRYDAGVSASEMDNRVLASSPHLEKVNTSVADYVILPIDFSGDFPRIIWQDQWRLEDYQ